jgi:hypothetical protein
MERLNVSVGKPSINYYIINIDRELYRYYNSIMLVRKLCFKHSMWLNLRLKGGLLCLKYVLVKMSH